MWVEAIIHQNEEEKWNIAVKSARGGEVCAMEMQFSNGSVAS